MKKSWASFVRMGVLGFVLLLLAACNSESSGDGKVAIEYWHMQVEEERVNVIEELIADFEEKNPDIDVKQVPIAEGDFPTKISASLGAGQMPALLEVGVDQALMLGQENVLSTELHTKIIKDIGKDDFYDGALNFTRAPGENGYYGVPMYGWVQGIWYRKDLFKEKGLEPPTNWENILKAAKAFHDPDNDKYGIVVGTNEDDFAEQTFSQYAISNKARVFGKEGKINFNSNEMVEALDYYKQLSQFTPPGAESWREARELYLSERAPMVMYSSYLMSDLVSNDMADVTGFAIPEKKQPATFGQITSLAIPNTVSDEEKAASEKFLRFLMEDENYIKYLHMSPGGANPTLKSIAESEKYLSNETLKAYGEGAADIAAGLESLKRFGFQENTVYPEMGDISSKHIIGKAIFNMTVQDQSPKEVAEKAQESMKKTVNQ
ncbi:ABC transporter substrate-binding protein [Thalassobacillus pellis]|uniref:ABC transporter substrate-binding protein n=1 Tax=Thalassobacillus pellis TaxID=748008 RepID=UPI00195FF044|nr:sugar ABC transporter substrate-binding protein [Thalassobacillus pellis]MBM7553380.1 multiple sugar transport system substrate-binding protein [Thalassobacillus pellis]